MQDDFKPRIKEKYDDSKSCIENWEREFYIRECREPTLNDMDVEQKKALECKKNAKILMKHWGIN